MTDRGRLHTLSEGDSAQDVLDLARETGHSRFPVIGDDSDDILGLVSLRRAVAVPAERRADVPVVSSSLMTDAPSVPETAPIGPLMVQLRDEGLQMAVVVDEYGGVSGIVTLEDVVEEIVGGSPTSTTSAASASGHAPTARSSCPARCAPTSSRAAPTSTCPRTAPTTRSAASS